MAKIIVLKKRPEVFVAINRTHIKSLITVISLETTKKSVACPLTILGGFQNN